MIELENLRLNLSGCPNLDIAPVIQVYSRVVKVLAAKGKGYRDRGIAPRYRRY